MGPRSIQLAVRGTASPEPHVAILQILGPAIHGAPGSPEPSRVEQQLPKTGIAIAASHRGDWCQQLRDQVHAMAALHNRYGVRYEGAPGPDSRQNVLRYRRRADSTTTSTGWRCWRRYGKDGDREAEIKPAFLCSPNVPLAERDEPCGR